MAVGMLETVDESVGPLVPQQVSKEQSVILEQ
jgi:hypothetical protein